jgi:DNA damage-binding protein 1
MLVPELSQFNCSPNEEITALQSMSLSYDDHTLPYLCVGTFTYHSDEKEPTEGRLLVFDVHEIPSARGQQLSLVASVDVNGCVYALAAFDEMIAAAVNASVHTQ